MSTTLLTAALTALMLGGGDCGARETEDRKQHEALVRWVAEYDREHPVVDDADKEAEERAHWELTHR